MNLDSRMNQLLIILVYFSTYAIHVKSELFPTLTFAKEGHAIINLNRKIRRNEKLTEHSIALACPATGPEENKFNSKSLGNSSLFVKDVYDVPSDPDQAPIELKDIIYKICQDPFKMSICFYKPSAEFLFGYEIYYNLDFKGIKSNNYDDFDYIENAFTWSISLTKKSKPQLKLKKTPLGFLWILSFRLIFDNNLSRPRQVIYTVTKAAETGISCIDNNLGKEIYENKKIDLKFLYDNQKDLFKNVNVPNYINEEKKEACGVENQCLTKGSLIPPEEFRFRFPEPKSISCSDLTTVPIWDSIATDALYKIDRFLYALAKVTHRDLHLAAGVHGKLRLPIKNKLDEFKTIKLGKIPVPNVIYKMVKYHVPVKEYDDELFIVTKAVIILIYNDPHFDPKDAACSRNNCDNWGWKAIQYRGIPSIKGDPSNYVFCCPQDEKTLKYLNMKVNKDNIHEVLNLKYIHVYDKKSDTSTPQDIEQRVIDKMGNLNEDEKEPDGNQEDEELQKDESVLYFSSEDDEEKAETTQDPSSLLSRSTTTVSSGNEDEDEDKRDDKTN